MHNPLVACSNHARPIIIIIMFGNLKFYSEYSLEYGAIKIKDLVKKLVENKYDYACLTDYFNLSGSLQFFNLLTVNNIKPIIGCEIYTKNLIKGTYLLKGRLTLIAINFNGYREICNLINLKRDNKYLNIFKVIKNKNLIILSGGYGGFFTNLLKLKKKLFLKILSKLSLNKNFYLEIQRFNRKSLLESKVLISISKSFNLNLVATHPTRFLEPDDIKILRYKRCILKKSYLANEKVTIKKYKNNFLLNKRNFIATFSDIKVAIRNSNKIACICSFRFKVINNFSNVKSDSNLINIVKKSLFFSKLNFFYRLRLKYELKTILNMGFSKYFLIVYDFVNWAKKNDIPVGPGRGSSASSLVAYLLKITDIDPMVYNLIFERFLNSKKNSIPDFDIDFCKLKRNLVIKYIKHRYGLNNVFNIVTFGRFSFKNSIKDSGRIMGYNFSYLNSISNKIKFIGKSFSEILIKNPELNYIYSKDKRFRELIAISKCINGYIRNIGVHAGGLIINKNSLLYPLPLYFIKKEKKFVTQFDKIDIEKIGFIKFDLLGLNTLTIFKDIVKKIRLNFSFKSINFSNNETFALLGNGNTTGVFQLESFNLKKYLILLKPTNLNDIINLIALYRPGPMLLIEDFCNKKKSFFIKDQSIASVLTETRGILIFQEQLIKIMQKKYFLSLNDSDIFRSVLLKGNRAAINNMAKKLGVNINTKFFANILKFSGYSFNKAHAVSYSYITYSMAFLKTHFITYFFVSNLNHSFKNSNKLISLYLDCSKNNIRYISPNINLSSSLSIITDNKKILIGFLFIKNVSKVSVKEIIKKRFKKKFSSFFDFFFRINKKFVSIRVIKNLIYCGAFDSINSDRSFLLGCLSSYLANYSYYISLYNKQTFFTNQKIGRKKINIFKKEKETLGYIFTNMHKKYVSLLKYHLKKNIGFNYFFGAYVFYLRLSNFLGIIHIEQNHLLRRKFYIDNSFINKINYYDIILVFYSYSRKKNFFCFIKKIIKLND